jgi:hypothetical protein
MTGFLYERARLRLDDRDAMYRLLARHFEGVSRDRFEEDLAEKNWAILLRDDGGDLQGFTTLRLYDTHHGLDRCSVIFSGDTIVDPRAWGRSRLLRAWLDAVLHLRGKGDPSRPLYWLLITSGFRTYRFLPLFWRWFFPRFDRVTPPGVQEFMDRLATDRFGAHFHPEEGIVQFPRPQRLRSHLAGIPQGRLDDPHIRYFAERNPDADAGDELVCLTRIDEGNLTPAGERVLRSLRPAAAVGPRP